MATSTGNKRQRHSVHTTSNSSLQLLTDLPNDALLPNVASFLPRTSCVSFAMAMTKQPLDGIPSSISIAIATASSENWESIDFKDIQEGVYGGRSLTDDDIRWVLLCIDAPKITKSLKFTNCVGITGSGLEPLMGSTVLERIDLSLVGDHQVPNIKPEPPISSWIVIPILESILNTENNSLIHVQLPKKWREERGILLNRFMKNMDRTLNNRKIQCSTGCGICKEWTYARTQYSYGLNTITCYQCTEHLCSECFRNELIDMCQCCEKVYCNDCNKVLYCVGCNTSSCRGCDIMKVCENCEVVFRPNCNESWATCQFCGKICCWECAFGECMQVCNGLWHYNVECIRLNCKPTYECTTRKSWWKRVNRCYWHREEHSDSSLCNGCYYYGFTLFVFDSLIVNNVRMLGEFISMCWGMVQSTIRYLRSLPWNNIHMLWEAICMFWEAICMLWELVQSTIGYLRALPWFREKVPEKKNKSKKKKRKWQKKRGKHR